MQIPQGPLTVGHGRGAILGDTLSNIFEWNGYTVEDIITIMLEDK